jgi:hypothetical protein
LDLKTALQSRIPGLGDMAAEPSAARKARNCGNEVAIIATSKAMIAARV